MQQEKRKAEQQILEERRKAEEAAQQLNNEKKKMSDLKEEMKKMTVKGGTSNENLQNQCKSIYYKLNLSIVLLTLISFPLHLSMYTKKPQHASYHLIEGVACLTLFAANYYYFSENGDQLD